MKKKIVIISIIAVIVITAIITGVYIVLNKNDITKAGQVLETYISYISEKKYEEMYDLISDSSKDIISKEDFINRNKNIYEGIDASDIKLEISEILKTDDGANVPYVLIMNTVAGEVTNSYTANFYINKDKEYKLSWSSNLIFPNLGNEDKVRVRTITGERGEITDRTGISIANNGLVSSVGLVPGKMSENKEADIQKISELLDVSVKSIENALSASYVKDDTFVPIKKISRENEEVKTSLLGIKGILISNEESRVYPYGEVLAHLTGYVQGISAEELTENQGKGYTQNSLIGKTGLEKVYEDRLRAKNGVEIYIENKDGTRIADIIKKEVQNGEDIKLTIDIETQKTLYDQIKNDKGLFVVMKPKTGELLALVSSPSYDPNDFVLGMSQAKWDSINSNQNMPMMTRYLQSWCPGSTFKPITGGIGLTSGKLSVDDEFSYTGLSWQKDSSWGSYNITTLTSYSSSKNLKNAMMYSDNIYFANAALKIGKETFEEGLKKLGFNEKIDFELSLSKSQFSNTDSIETEIGLADSGYGQGKILVNPIHMASIYSAFANNGNMIKPYLIYNEGKSEYLKEGVFTEEAANIIKEDLIRSCR